MTDAAPRIDTPSPDTARPWLNWRRVRATLIASVLLGLFLSVGYKISFLIVLLRALVTGLCAMLAFSLLERWPARLPRNLARWVAQIMAIVAVMPFATLLAYWLTTGGHPHLTTDPEVGTGYGLLTFTGILFAPWIALGALVRQRDAFAREQASAFALERSELERRALEARFRLLQAQVEPHFLFNTLANVQTLVETGAPQASQVLKSLIAYLRAAVPRLHEAMATVDQELQLVRAYLEVMHMRMPDRLQFELHADDAALGLRCPPMTLLTLVENAVRHGIDPNEDGGRITVDVRLQAGRCCARVTDTGVGLKPLGGGLGTGLAALRERLQLAFGDAAELQLRDIVPHGVQADLTFPARASAP